MEKADRSRPALTRDVVPRTAGNRTLAVARAEDLFRQLPLALEHPARHGLIDLLSPGEVTVALEAAGAPDRSQRVGRDQAFYMLRGYFANVPYAAQSRIGLDGFASPSGRLVCEPRERDGPDREHALLHLMVEGADGPVHQRILVEARRFPTGWRATEFRVLD